MTVSATELRARNTYTGNGATTTFNFTFEVLKESNAIDNKLYSLSVFLVENNIETAQVEDDDYTVNYNTETRLGSITFGTAPTSSQTIVLLSNIQKTQSTDYINIGNDKFPAKSHEGTVDKLTLIVRELQEQLDRAITLSKASTATNITIPVSVANADKAIVVNSAGDDLTAKSLLDINTYPITSFAETLLDDETASQARTTLDAQQLNANLTALASLTGASNKLPYFTGAGEMALRDLFATTSTKGVSLLPQQITIANNSTDSEHDLNFTAGNAQADDGLMVWRASALTKQIDASWVAGNNQGGLFTGTVANDTWYHCFAIYNPTTGVADFGFDTDLSAANAPAGFTKKMYRGSILTDGDSNILPFKQKGNYFEWKTVVLDLSIGSVVSTRTSFPISTPLGIEVLANIRAGFYLNDPNDLSINILSPYNNNLIPVSGGGNPYDADIGSDSGYTTTTNLQVMTNTSSQIDYQASRATGLTGALRVRTKGYFNYNI